MNIEMYFSMGTDQITNQARTILNVLENKDNNVNYTTKSCLCNYVDILLKNKRKIDLFLVHPHNNNQRIAINDNKRRKCYNSIRRIIRAYPNSHFYIFALNDSSLKEPRKEGIGEFPNVTYMDRSNIAGKLIEFELKCNGSI